MFLICFSGEVACVQTREKNTFKRKLWKEICHSSIFAQIMDIKVGSLNVWLRKRETAFKEINISIIVAIIPYKRGVIMTGPEKRVAVERPLMGYL